MKRLFRFSLIAAGALLSAYLCVSLIDLLSGMGLFFAGNAMLAGIMKVGLSLLGLILGAVAAALLYPRMAQGLHRIDCHLRTMPISTLLVATGGALVGFLAAFLLSNLAAMISYAWLRVALSVLLYVVLGYGSVRLALQRRQELNIPAMLRRSLGNTGEEDPFLAPTKLLDGSALMDGRVFEICKAGFLEGDLMVAQFTLSDLRRLAREADDVQSAHAKRGLDLLTRLQMELNRPVHINETDYPDLADATSKLLRLAGECGATLLSADATLCKTAQQRHITVRNINDLSNALKPVVTPGERMQVRILRAGREAGQGVAYLSDGTMMVVEAGQDHIGETLTVEVTSSLQTSAGRMIFSRIVSA